MLLALAIIMSASLASRMFITIMKQSYEGNASGVLATIVVEGGLYQTTLWVLWAHT